MLGCIRTVLRELYGKFPTSNCAVLYIFLSLRIRCFEKPTGTLHRMNKDTIHVKHVGTTDCGILQSYPFIHLHIVFCIRK